MAKFIEIKILGDSHSKRIINVEQIGCFFDASDANNPKRIFINASNYAAYAPYTVDEFLKLIS